MGRSQTLKYRYVLKWPWFGEEFPSGVLADDGFGIAKVRLKVCPKMKADSLPGSIGYGGQEVRLHDTVLVVTSLRPRVREKDEDPGEGNSRRKCVQEISGVGMDEMEIS